MKRISWVTPRLVAYATSSNFTARTQLVADAHLTADIQPSIMQQPTDESCRAGDKTRLGSSVLPLYKPCWLQERVISFFLLLHVQHLEFRSYQNAM